jgi:hypothetical protein
MMVVPTRAPVPRLLPWTPWRARCGPMLGQPAVRAERFWARRRLAWRRQVMTAASACLSSFGNCRLSFRYSFDTPMSK